MAWLGSIHAATVVAGALLAADWAARHRGGGRTLGCGAGLRHLAGSSSSLLCRWPPLHPIRTAPSLPGRVALPAGYLHTSASQIPWLPGCRASRVRWPWAAPPPLRFAPSIGRWSPLLALLRAVAAAALRCTSSCRGAGAWLPW
ncbi:hypothetical protein U9M48_008662 [Paspalum notatum var. saurae]|uniref:Secreted protein n=1 Tax=Paspalum notatum var. saurae TaxID=547442 RepID=A0AAQ3SPI4_PASNO